MATLIKTFLLILEEFTYLVFPLSEDERLIKSLSPDNLVNKLHVRQCDGTTVLTLFADPEIRALLHLVKFHRHPRALALTALVLKSWLCSQTCESAVLIPVPLSKERLRRRGYNQTELIARAAIKHLPQYRVDTKILVRTRNTPSQTSLKRKARLKNMVNAFSVSPSATKLSDTDIILIDDVLTTGATLAAAKTALQTLSPKSITCVAIAH